VRTLDIAAGTFFALLSIALLAAVNPAIPKEEADDYAARSITRKAILSFVRSDGLRWIASAPLSDLCNELNHTVSPVRINLIRDGGHCLPSGANRHGYSEVTLALGAVVVRLEGWIEEGLQ